VNRGVPADADVIVVTDADIAVPAAALEWAVDACSGFGAAWAVPFSTVYRLNQETTAWLLASGWDANITAMSPGQCVQHRPPYPAYPGGGLFVVARDAWETVGGFDERFVWGYEDQSLGWALDTLAGPHVQYDGPLVHLFHEQRRTSRAMYDDQRLQASYLAARGKPDAMRALVRERSTIERA
jgi:GT2 family glycosyltransferase